MSITTDLLHDIEAFLAEHGMGATTFGRLAVADPHVVRRLRDGFGINSTRIDCVREFMATYRGTRTRKHRRPRTRPKSQSADQSAA